MEPFVTRHLTVACGDYDINHALATGGATARGLSLTVLRMPSPERHRRMARHREFDVCELSMATYLAILGTGDRSLVAIPAFPHRRFRHGFIFVAERADIATPADLNGRRVGLRTWQTTAGLWARGILQDEHGVDLQSIEWVTQDAEDVPMEPDRVPGLRRVPEGGSVVGMLRAGDLDALIYPEAPVGVPGIRRLFADSRAAEIAYYQRTGIFPIMHTVVVRRELVDEMPWMPREVLEAFRRSKQIAFEAMRDPRRVSLAWWREALEQQEEVLGPDPWAYDYERNRAALETIVRYAHEQGMLPEPLPARDLFVPSTLEDPPRYV